MTTRSLAVIPPAVLVYGVLGIVPFVAPPLLSLAAPGLAAPAAAVLAGYAALILSFLGGARWAFEVARPHPRALVVGLAMLPTLAGFALLLMPEGWRAAQLLGLAALLALHLAWDNGTQGLPHWYPRLRLLLTLGAVIGLAGQIAIIV